VLGLISNCGVNGMKGLSLKVAHEEVISLIQRAVEEFEEGQAHVGVSILLEAQFLLGDVIAHELYNIHSAPPLSPSESECSDQTEEASHAAIT
jgi:hypothetical protein